jgi:hypothetical protein
MQIYRSGSGPGYWPGEVAGFPPAIAEDLVERGIAVRDLLPAGHADLATPAQPSRPLEPKGPDRPDRDAMIPRPPVKK